MKVPSTIISYGVTLQGRRTDGTTYIVYLLSTRFGSFEDERQLTSGTPSGAHPAYKTKVYSIPVRMPMRLPLLVPKTSNDQTCPPAMIRSCAIPTLRISSRQKKVEATHEKRKNTLGYSGDQYVLSSSARARVAAMAVDVPSDCIAKAQPRPWFD
eukprot:8847239-Pyramimonas_sp.AAC.1